MESTGTAMLESETKRIEIFPPVVFWKQVKMSIMRNERAVYGYSPRKDSVSIGIHADWPWEDEAFVSCAREMRLQYRKELEELSYLAQRMYLEGADDETVARTISRLRNKERIHAWKQDTHTRERLLQNNEKRYGTTEGISADAAYQKYGSWKRVLKKSLSINMGMDVCCGLCKVRENEKP